MASGPNMGAVFNVYKGPDSHLRALRLKPKTAISRNRLDEFSLNFQGCWGTSGGTPEKKNKKSYFAVFPLGGAKGQTLGRRSAITGRRRRPDFGANGSPSDSLRRVLTPRPWGMPPIFWEFFKILENLGGTPSGGLISEDRPGRFPF